MSRVIRALVSLVIVACSSGTVAPTAPRPTVSPTGTASPATVTPSPSASLQTTPPSSVAPSSVAVLPSEQWLLYHWFLPGTDKRVIYLAHPDGSNAQRILKDVPGDSTSATWSPDGNRIAFGNGRAIWTANAEGTEAELLTDGEGMCQDGAHYPDWSPDGSKLALICYTDAAPGGGSLATFDLDTRKVSLLYKVEWPEHLDVGPRWSPDGASIALAILHWDPTDRFLDGSLIAVVPAVGGEAHRLTEFDTFMSSPDWRPDGSELVMSSYDMGNMHTTDQPSNLYLIKPNGTDQRQITSSSVDGNMRIVFPRWTPDGSRILVSVGMSHASNMTTDDLQLALIDAVGSEPVLLSPTVHGAAPDLRPVPSAP